MAKQQKQQMKKQASLTAQDDGFPRAVAIPKGRGSRLVGKLRAMLRMPMDVFVAIASFLEPIDILQLSRTSNHFRGSLMSKHSRLIWRASWMNVSVEREVYDKELKCKIITDYVPPCPPGMSEPLLVALVFERGFCTACGRKTTIGSDIVLRVRACKNCPVAGLQTGTRLLREMRKEMRVTSAVKRSNTDYILYSMVPHNTLTFCPRPNYTPSVAGSRCALWSLSTDLFVSAAFTQIAKRYYELLLSNDEHLDEFVEEKQKEVQELWDHTEKVTEYINLRDRAQFQVNTELSDSFRQTAHEKLHELGYSGNEFRLKMLSSSQRFEFYTLLSQKRLFTDRIWENLRPKLEDLLQTNRAKQQQTDLARRRRHIGELIVAKLSETTDDEGIPVTGRTYALPLPGCLEFAPIKKFLDEKEKDLAYDNLDSLPKKDWSTVVQYGFYELIKDRRDAGARALLHLLIRGVSGLGIEEVCDLLDELDRPSSDRDIKSLVASCCDVVVPAGFNIHHPAAFFLWDEIYSLMRGKLCSYDDIYNSLHQEEGRFDELVLSAQRPTDKGDVHAYWIGSATGMRISMVLLDDLGYAPADAYSVDNIRKQVSMKDMIEKGTVFVCMCCPEDGRIKRGWRGLIQHFYYEIDFLEFMGELKITAVTVPLSNAHDCRVRVRVRSSIADSDSSPSSSTDAHSLPIGLLAIESESFDNGSCPHGHDHEHFHAMGLPHTERYTCTLCRDVYYHGDYRRKKWSFEFSWLRCAEMHVRTRHGKTVEKGDIQMSK